MDPADLEKLEQLLNRQEEIGAEIESVVKNHKKSPQDRKNRTYYEKRLNQLKSLSEEFNQNDEWLQDVNVNFKTSQYFTQNYDVLIKKLVDQYVGIFSKELKETPTVLTEKDQTAKQKDLNTPFNNLIRRQNVMMSSLQRLLQMDVPEDAQASNLKAREKLWDQIQQLHFSIWEQHADPTTEGYDMEIFIELEERVMQTSTITASIRSNSSPTTVANVPLPKINIPKFDGDYGKWPTFADLFEKVIHCQPIPTVQKMWYLKTNLTDEAERLIRHLALTEKNYDTAWNMLKDRYNNTRVLTTTLIQQILDLQNISSNANSIKTFHDTLQENMAALKNMNIEIKGWDPLLLQILVKKLDRHTHNLYESSVENPRELQTLEDFLKFLEQRFQALESMGNKEKSQSSQKITASVTTSKLCKLCDVKAHPLYFCDKFKNTMSPSERLNWVQKQRLCVNCFKADHKAKACKSRTCTICNEKHNTLLHLEKSKTPQQSTMSTATTVSASPLEAAKEITPAVVTATSSTKKLSATTQNYVLLATAKIRIVANNGRTCIARAILDSCSQVNLVTKRLINRLSINAAKSQLSIEGIGQKRGSSTSRINVSMEALVGNFSTRIEAFVLPEIISAQPSRNIDVTSWKIPKNVQLADPEFFKPGRIDVLIGAEFYHSLLCPQQVSIGPTLPLLQNTSLGWIVTGKTKVETAVTAICAVFTHEDEKISTILEKFWQVEDVGDESKAMSKTEQACEKHFAENVSRNEQGRFVVRFPFSDDPSTLGESRYLAEKRLESLERRLAKQPQIKVEYTKFMDEYEKLGHMQKIQENDIPVSNYFIPHHCVLKPDSTSTKLRVVFDASAKTSSGIALNDILHKGPTIQSDLFSILLRFRTHRFVFTADIEKMYRQILVHQDDTAHQLIVWRKETSEKIQFYRLNTVTYGTTSAPYLAIKCLQQLALQNTANHPLGAEALLKDFYVDDCLSGANNITTCKEKQRQITELLQEAGFKLRKWCANHSQLLAGIPLQDQEINLDLDNESVKTLGMMWLPKSDQLCGRANLTQNNKFTKRLVLADLARIFDPLGIFGPVTVKAKLFVQQLWALKLSWDEELPQQLIQQWTHFRMNLSALNDVKTYRHIFNGDVPSNMQIHTFVDASEQAYGAAVYIRATYKGSPVTTRLLCAKSKVAPLQRLPIPRLELLAAVVGADLTTRVRKELKYMNVPTFFWTDSKIVLSWLQTSSSALYTFVANRVSHIQRITQVHQWYHVASKDNAADVLSRGISPEKLVSETKWFYGPLFLCDNKQWWLKPQPPVSEVPNDIERRSKLVVAINVQPTENETIIFKIDHRNNFRFLQHTVAYMLRPFVRPKLKNLTLSPTELRNALLQIVKALQSSEFRQDMRDLEKHKALGSSSTLHALTPFIDERGILRVGGRLEAATIAYDAKHPMLLPYNNPITKLLFKMTHENNSHCGPQALLAIIRQTFWPIKGKIMARNVVHGCIQCSKAKPKMLNQIMGDLPADRVTPARPFFKAGVDYAGPFMIHYKIRGKRPTKAYLAVFCCFTTKAVHLELVSDLTTTGFIGALKRFVSRRGRCQTIYSDNATNFVGAKNQFEDLKDMIHSDKAQESILKYSSDQGIDFKFIPPRAPHFGGLWEAAVKSAKHLLLRNTSSACLTYEELETIVVQVEAILNSRPLTPMSANPNDLSAITPGHFLIGEPLVAPPDPFVQQPKMSLVTHWKLVSHIQHEFWKRWSQEYLNELQHRNNWKTASKNLNEGEMVILKEDNMPVMKWPIGRVQKTYKGEDGFVRVAEIKTANGIRKRAVNSLAPLPTEGPIQSLLTTTSAYQMQDAVTIDQAESSTASKRRKLSSTFVMVTLLTCLFFPVICATSIKHHEFPNKPGLYFEGIGSISRTVGEWKIISYFDLEPIRTEMEIFRNGTSILQHLCPMLQQHTNCFELVRHFNNIDVEIQLEANLMKYRKTRGAMNVIGNIANKLFGVLDSDYAEEVSKVINQLDNNDQMLSRMIQNQTSVIDSTLNIVTKNTEAVVSKLNQLQSQSNNISKELNDAKRQIDLLEIYVSTATQLSLMAANLQRIESAIFDVLTDSRHGRINPLLLSPTQLHQEILTIKGHLPNSLHLPFHQDDAVHLYSFMSSQSGISSHHIMFILKLPLTDNDEFNLFNIIPIPATVNDTLLIIHPETTLLAVTPHRDQYFALSKDDLHDCIAIKHASSQLLCSDKSSRFHQGAQAYACEINMLKGKFGQGCVFEESKSDFIWSPLRQTNQWIFACKRSTQVTAVCNGTTELLDLQGANLITLQDDCILKHQTATIQTHQMFTDTLFESHAAFGVIEPLNSSETRMIISGSPLDIRHDLQQLRQLHETLKKDEFIKLPSTFAKENIHHHVIGYGALLLIIGTIICLIWRRHKSKQTGAIQESDKPTPAIRFTTDPTLVT